MIFIPSFLSSVRNLLSHAASSVMAVVNARRNQNRSSAISVLPESEQQFWVIADCLPAMIWVDDLHQQCVFVNRSWLDFTGRSREQELGSGWMQSIHPEDFQHRGDSYKAAVNAQQPYKVEYRLRRSDGEYRWVLETGSPRSTFEGKLVGYAGTCVDITERLQTETALRQSEERFRCLVENLREVFWMSSPGADSILYVSPAYEAVWGHSCESLYTNPRSWVDAVHPEDQGRLIASIKLQRGFDQEYRIQRSDGTIRWIRDRSFPVYQETGQLDCMVGIAEDITERKLVAQETQLLQIISQAIVVSEDFHSALQIALEKVCEATHWDFGEAWVPCADQSVLECSPAWFSKAESLIEFRRQSEPLQFAPGVGLPGRIWKSRRPEWCRDVSTESNTAYLRSALAMKVGLKAALGIPLLANDQVITVLVFYMSEARDEDQRLIDLIAAATELGLFVQRKQSEEEVRKSLIKEQELNLLKSNFISIVSHEFRTPLTSILLSSELLETQAERLTAAKRQSYFQRIRSSVRRMNQLIEEVLLIGQGERGTLEFAPAPLDLLLFCQTLIADAQAAASMIHPIQFYCQDEIPQVEMDVNLLQHILGNLLSNAIKYSPAGGAIRFELSQQSAALIFRIQDSGIGIPLADQQRLFQFFHRATNVASIPGTGLGLAIVKQCAELHGGQIEVESTVGRGTTFTVTLPLRLAESA